MEEVKGKILLLAVLSRSVQVQKTKLPCKRINV